MPHQQLVLVVNSTSLLAICPVCQTSSRQVHSYYTRTIEDLCWADRQARLELHVRRFVCSNIACSRRTFAEQFGEQIKAYARRTKRCASQLQTIGLVLGGNAGACLAKVLGIPVSSDTLLRLVRATEVPERSTPEVLSEAPSARLSEQWLKPGVKMVSRDRGGAYAEVRIVDTVRRFGRDVSPQLVLDRKTVAR